MILRVVDYVQALVTEAKRTDVGRDFGKVEISKPVFQGMRPAKRNDCTREGMVEGYVAGHAC